MCIRDRNKLVDYIRKSFRDTWLKNQGDPSRIVSLMDKINPNALLIGCPVSYTHLDGNKSFSKDIYQDYSDYQGYLFVESDRSRV